jgi:hypothetical protein
VERANWQTKLQLLPRWLTSSDFRLAFTSGVSANQVCFERELLEHYRLVFEKQDNLQDDGEWSKYRSARDRKREFAAHS